MTTPIVAQKSPYATDVEEGKTYYWCACGRSAKQPFCDGAHKQIEGMPFRSLRVKFDAPEDAWFCTCKQTSTPPFCDGSHSCK